MSEYDWTKSKSEYPFFCIECMEPVEKDICDTCGGEVNDRRLICECEDFTTLQKWLDSVSGLKKYVPELPASVAHLRHYYKHTDSDVVALCDYVDELRARIAELEAAQQWHPASEPPKNMQRVQIKTDGHILRATYVHSVIGYAVTFCDSRYIIARIAVDGWRDLPPMPEVEA